MVAIWQAHCILEEVLHLFFVKFCTSFITQSVIGHMEVGILSLLDQVSPLSALQTVSGPVPSILGLYDVKFIIKAEGHDIVSDSRTCSIHDHRVEAI